MSIRLDNLRTKLSEKGLDAILVSNPENRHYLSGFTGSSGYLVVSREVAVLATDFRYLEQAGNQSPEFRVIQVGSGWSWLPDLLRGQEWSRMGFESHQMTVDTYRHVTEALSGMPISHQTSLVASTGMVEGMRSIKDHDELVMLQKAIDVSDGAIDEVSPTIRPGETEREVAWRLEKAMRELGADSLSFETIVAAGPNGAMPHHRPTDRAISRGEPVVIDMGAKVGGYCSDVSRTVCVGEPDETFRRVYDTVLGAQLTAIATVRMGMSAGDADGLSRTVIAEAGYGDNFGHSLGHGVGLVIHEYPRLGPKSDHPLVESMVFTVEPGIYISGWGGVRIEDVVLLQEDGAKVLSKASK